MATALFRAYVVAADLSPASEPSRSEGGQRRYSSAHADRLAFIRHARELGFPLTFRPGIGTLEWHKGYLPMRLRGEESGVEFDVFDRREDVQE